MLIEALYVMLIIIGILSFCFLLLVVDVVAARLGCSDRAQGIIDLVMLVVQIGLVVFAMERWFDRWLVSCRE